MTKPLERAGLGDEEWGTQCAADLSKLGAEGWEVCGQGTGPPRPSARERYGGSICEQGALRREMAC